MEFSTSNTRIESGSNQNDIGYCQGANFNVKSVKQAKKGHFILKLKFYYFLYNEANWNTIYAILVAHIDFSLKNYRSTNFLKSSTQTNQLIHFCLLHLSGYNRLIYSIKSTFVTEIQTHFSEVLCEQYFKGDFF